MAEKVDVGDDKFKPELTEEAKVAKEEERKRVMDQNETYVEEINDFENVD